MQKLKLDLETLAVESFETDRSEPERGTVEAHASYRCSENPDRTCGPYTCEQVYTCGFRSCDTVCGTYFCTDETAAQTCGDYCTIYSPTCPFSCHATCTC